MTQHCRDLTHDRLVENLGALVGVGGVGEVVKTKTWALDERDPAILAIYFVGEVMVRKAGRVPGETIVERTMTFVAVRVQASPVSSVNTLEADQSATMAAVERIVGADPHLTRDGVPLLFSLFVSQGGTGFDSESAGATLALAACTIVAVAHHVEGRPDVTLSQASY